MEANWISELSVACTVLDTDGKIIYMNQKACKTFEKDGGAALLGTNALDCHPEPARTKLAGMLKEPYTNAYTIEKGGVKKLIYQTPWKSGGTYSGIVELSLELPAELPHHVRKP